MITKIINRKLPVYLQYWIKKYKENSGGINLFSFENYQKTSQITVDLIESNIINITVKARTSIVQVTTNETPLEAGKYKVKVRMKRIVGKGQLRIYMQKNSDSGEFLFAKTMQSAEVTVGTDYEYEGEFEINENITLITRCYTNLTTSTYNKAGDKIEYEINLYKVG